MSIASQKIPQKLAEIKERNDLSDARDVDLVESFDNTCCVAYIIMRQF